ncbi:MAG: hypothetical protein WA962_03465 [Ornithinimicrobium sp.]
MVVGSVPAGLSVAPVPGISRSSASALGNLLTGQRQAAREADWAALLPVSLTLLGAAHGHGLAVRAVRATTAAQADLTRDVVTGLLDGVTRLAARPDHVQQAQGIRELLQSVDPSLAARAGPLLDQVAAGVVDVQMFADGEGLAGQLGQAPATDLEAALCVAASTRGLLGLVHVLLNTAHPPVPDLALFGQHLEDLHTSRTQVDTALRGAEVALFTACVGGQRDSVVAAAGALLATAQGLISPFVAQQGQGRVLVQALRSAGRNGDAEQVGRVLAISGWLVRRAVADAAVGAWLGLELSRRVLPDSVTTLLQAQGVAFDGPLPNGRDVPIGGLTASDDGAFVQVEGFVTGATAAREPDGKLVGRLRLLDPSSNAAVNVATVFLHPAHVGITLGSYVIVHGTYRTASARLGGGPGLETDTLAPTKLGAQSWQARLWFAATRWIDLWRGNLNLTWSLGTHTPGPDDSQEPTRGAAELIYLPFARTEDL